MIPFIDLKLQYRGIKNEIDEAILSVLESTQFVLGKEVDLFEREFAEYCGSKHAVAVNSGTSALHLALLAADWPASPGPGRGPAARWLQGYPAWFILLYTGSPAKNRATVLHALQVFAILIAKNWFYEIIIANLRRPADRAVGTAPCRLDRQRTRPGRSTAARLPPRVAGIGHGAGSP